MLYFGLSLPPRRSLISSVYSAAQQDLSAEAQRCVQGRPKYPEALSDWLRDALNLRPQTAVVDLGAGTGKFTRLLARTDTWVVAVESADATRAQLAKALPQVQALAGNARLIPLVNGFADTPVCAQASHWFATVGVLEEMRRVLTTEDRLGLVWDVRDESLDWVTEITRTITPYEGNAPRFYKGDWHRPFERASFELLRLSAFAYKHVGPPEQVTVSRFLSTSFTATLPEAEKNVVAIQLHELIVSHPALEGEEQMALSYHTEAYLAEARQACRPAA